MVDELIDLMGLGAGRQKLTGELSTGTRRIIDLACILAQDPKALMLGTDETAIQRPGAPG